MLSLQNISKSFHNTAGTQEILRNVSLDVAAGEVVALVGRSGSGKSTLLSLVAGLDSADAGSVSIAGELNPTHSEETAANFRLRNIGLIFQFFNLLPTLTIFQNVSLPGLLLGGSKTEVKRRVVECLDLLGIESLAQRLPHEISGGELQRAAIARAILNKPKVLLADEPTGNLDSENAQTVFSLFLELARDTGTALLLVTHDKDLATQADRILTLREGRLSQ